jgi:hypothetical protein
LTFKSLFTLVITSLSDKGKCQILFEYLPNVKKWIYQTFFSNFFLVLQFTLVNIATKIHTKTPITAKTLCKCKCKLFAKLLDVRFEGFLHILFDRVFLTIYKFPLVSESSYDSDLAH